MTDWPSTLPQRIQRDGARHVFGDNKVSFQPDDGDAMERRKGSAGPDEFACMLTISSAQYETFSTFYKTTLKQGTQTFNWRHPVTGAAAVVRIKDRPEFSAVGGGFWRLSMNLVILP